MRKIKLRPIREPRTRNQLGGSREPRPGDDTCARTDHGSVGTPEESTISTADYTRHTVGQVPSIGEPQMPSSRWRWPSQKHVLTKVSPDLASTQVLWNQETAARRSNQSSEERPGRGLDCVGRDDLAINRLRLTVLAQELRDFNN